MSRYDSVVRDVRGLQRAGGAQRQLVDQIRQEDQVFDQERRLLLRSPNGTFFAIVVDDAGGLSTVNVGANPL